MIAKLYSTLFFFSLILCLSAQSSQTSCLTFNLGTALGDDSQQIQEQLIFPLTTYGYNDVTAWVIDVEYDTLLLEYEGWYPTYFEPNEGPFISTWPGHINIVFYGAEAPITINDGEQLGFFRFDLREEEGSAAGSSLQVEAGDLGAQAFGPDFDAISVAVIDGIVPDNLEVGQFDPGQACMQSLPCMGETQGVIEIFVPDTVSTPAFNWFYEGQVISTSQNLEALTAGGRYDLIMSAEGQYDRHLSAFLLEETELNSIYVESLQQLDCFDTAATGSLRVSGFDPSGSTILWSNGATTAQIDNLAEGFYSVRVTDNVSGCSAFSFGRVYRASNRTVELIVQDDYRCTENSEPNGSISVQVTDLGGEPAPQWFFWEPSGIGSGPELTGLSAGTYQVRISGPDDACTTIMEASIITENISTAARTSAANCGQANGSLELLRPDPTLNYLWNDGSTENSRYNLLAGSYALTVTSPNGCEASSSYRVRDLNINSLNTVIDCATDEVVVRFNSPMNRGDFIWGVDTLAQSAFSSRVALEIAEQNELTIALDDNCELSLGILELPVGCVNNPIGGDISIQVDHVIAENGPGSTVCVPLRITDFTAVVTTDINFSLNFLVDDSQLFLESVEAFSPLIAENIGWEPNDGNSILAEFFIPDLADISADGKLLEFCFNVLGHSGSTPILQSHTAVSSLAGSGVNFSVNIEEGSVSFTEDAIWPGDANDNARADHYDLLDIGLGYGLFGPGRDAVSINWAAQISPAWPGISPLSGANWQHSDADGNGVINAGDIEALETNWGQTRPLNELPALSYTPQILQSDNSAPLFVVPDTVSNNSGLQVFNIHLGDADFPASEVYGLAFSLGYDAAAINEEQLNVDFLETWLGELGDDLIATYRNFPEEERIDIAISRTDGQSMNGMGTIASLNITIEDVIFRGIDYELMFSIFDQIIITSAGSSLYSNAQTTTSLITTTTAVQQLPHDDRWQVYPNPSSGWLQLTHPEGFRPAEVQIYTLAGQSVYHQNRPDYRLDIEELPAGPYLLKIVGDGTVTMKRFVMR